VKLSRPCQPVGSVQGHSQKQGAGARAQKIDGLRHTGRHDAKAGDVLQWLEDVEISQKCEDQQGVCHDDPRKPESGGVHAASLFNKLFDRNYD